MKYKSCWFCNSNLIKFTRSNQCQNIFCKYKFIYYPKSDKILVGRGDVGYATNIIHIDYDIKIKIQKDCSSEEIISLYETLEVFI